MSGEIFRFVPIRPPRRVCVQDISSPIVRTYAAGNETTLHDKLKQARSLDNARERMVSLASEFIKSNQFVRELAQLENLESFDKWLLCSGSSLTLEKLKEEIIHVFGMEAPQLTSSQEYKGMRSRISDSLIAVSISSNGLTRTRSTLMRAMRLCSLLESVANDDPILTNRLGFEKQLRAIVLLPSDIFPLPESKNTDREKLKLEYLKLKKEADERLDKIKNVMAKARKIREAIDDLKGVYEMDVSKRSTVDSIASSTPNTKSNMKKKKSLSESKPLPPWILTEESTKKLRNDTRSLLTERGVSTDKIEVPKTVSILEKELEKITLDLYNTEGLKNSTRIGNTMANLKGLAPSVMSSTGFTIPWLISPELPDSSFVSTATPSIGGRRIEPIGMGDLMLVRQKLMRYEDGEVAHIENVLKGEYKERKHRRTRRVEEALLRETEKVEETEQDLQTTERFELQTELSQIIYEDMAFGTGVTANYYGFNFDVTANADFGYESSKEESSSVASSYARDVSDRSLKRVQERIREQRTRITIDEIEEINTHGINNKENPSGNIVGLYRWVDKIYQAQVINYGERLMFEFIIPEPAAFFRYSMSMKTKSPTMQEPIPPYVYSVDPYYVAIPPYWITSSTRIIPLAAEHISEANYLVLMAMYNAQGIEPPPLPWQIIATTLAKKSSGESPSIVEANKDLKIPEGYRANFAFIQGYFLKDNRSVAAFHGLTPYVSILVGDHRADIWNIMNRYNTSGFSYYTDSFTHSHFIDNIVPISVSSLYVASYAFNVAIECTITVEKYKEWQIKTFNAIMNAYNELKSKYEEHIRALEIEEGTKIGTNPLRNREIEKTELKKAAITMLTGNYYNEFNAMVSNAPPHNYPEIDLSEAHSEGRFIQFFETAFEWQNITYVFYPYFWGKKNEWTSNMKIDDVDPLFANFLQAGAARVRAPVRKGWDNIVLNYMATNPVDPWGDGDPPQIDDELYLSIVEEIMEQHGHQFKKGEGTISVTNGSPTIVASGPFFMDSDVDREILIKGRAYRITEKISQMEIKLSENYKDSTEAGLSYSLSEYHLVDEPWELRVPTTLVHLQEVHDLPTFE